MRAKVYITVRNSASGMEKSLEKKGLEHTSMLHSCTHHHTSPDQHDGHFYWLNRVKRVNTLSTSSLLVSILHTLHSKIGSLRWTQPACIKERTYFKHYMLLSCTCGQPIRLAVHCQPREHDAVQVLDHLRSITWTLGHLSPRTL
ncbi:hypothetical protein DUNSADRAFT_9411 [Dunaliella salina]|uniref:Encoded protein n=1 Tax=Dunaliella salina TaxID=3046 RepID=A0ABQ7GHI7_DUNSA|nr:hypothetical protein DUNSADRAFT_9411 [Dunaliella salina]|eukprot:KAF5834061.1 hypothetical protein DUNSADRAFT_9411 [Dunaliella salina]